MGSLHSVYFFVASSDISVFEAVMFICFGLSWPFSVIKALKTKKVLGKSPLFLSLIAFGYISGISHKLLYSNDYLIFLYLFNLTMILTDLFLYTKYSFAEKKRAPQAASLENAAAGNDRRRRSSLRRLPQPSGKRNRGYLLRVKEDRNPPLREHHVQ